MSARVGRIGETYEYAPDGRRFHGTDRQTFDELIEFSRSWPNTYHAHVDAETGQWRWAYRGREIHESELPAGLRPDTDD